VDELTKTYPITPPSTVQVPETRFGIWFLGTNLWVERVLDYAVKDLEGLIVDRKPSYPIILDVGSGWGQSFKFLKETFLPDQMIGVDVNPKMLEIAIKQVRKQKIDVEFIRATSSSLPLTNQSVDMIFCHQTFHHLVHQEDAIQEFHRVLKPGGVLLFAESTRAYIHSWIIRYLFHHPMDVQKSAPEYLDLIRSAGFRIDPTSISLPYLWWSRSDLGIMQNWFGRIPPEDREETLLNLVAVRE